MTRKHFRKQYHHLMHVIKREERARLTELRERQAKRFAIAEMRDSVEQDFQSFHGIRPYRLHADAGVPAGLQHALGEHS